MKRRYKISDINIEASISDQLIFETDANLEAFQIDSESDSEESVHRFTFQKTEELSEPEGDETASFSGYKAFGKEGKQIRYIGSVKEDWKKAYMRVEHDGFNHSVQLKASEYKDKIGPKTILNAIAAEHLFLESKGVVLHASFVEYNGKAILFTAPSGTGKSTQADLWAKHKDAEIVNGDRAVIRFLDGKAYASGIPFAGSSNYCKNKTIPLSAIVYLGQAPKTSIEKLENTKAFRKVWEECTVNTWNVEDVEKATDIVLSIIGEVPVFFLNCTPDISAVEALENELIKHQNL